MQNEYLFYAEDGLEFPLDSSILVSDKSDNGEYLVSNTDIPNTQVYAPEINFYLKNTADEIGKQIENIKKLYDVRATVYDFAQDLDFVQEVGNKLLIVTDEENTELVKNLKEEDFSIAVLTPESIVDVNGNIGKLIVTVKKEEELIDVDCDQIIWNDAPLFATKQSGTYDSNVMGLEKAIEKAKLNRGQYNYKNFIKYNSQICQYHERREEICGNCADICPTVAIMKVDKTKHLEFSHIDCTGCGGCISICPSGAIDYSQMPRIAFTELCEFYRDSIALITPSKMNIESLHVELPQSVLPLAIEGEKYLHEAHLMTLLQTSGNPVVFYTDFVSKGTGDVIRIINEIFKKKYNKQAIFICKDENELKEVLPNLQSLEECKHGFNEEGMQKREIFSARLAHLVGEDDLGDVETGEYIHYGNIEIDQDKCTLCLSCVGACNVRALTAHPEDNTLRFNPSICTNCGYCETTCPEDALHVVYDKLSLSPNYFKQNVKSTDEIFKCVECGYGFATVKSIEKIAKKMTPIFAGDEARIKALYCCADCKPKVTLQAYINKQREGINVK